MTTSVIVFLVLGAIYFLWICACLLRMTVGHKFHDRRARRNGHR